MIETLLWFVIVLVIVGAVMYIVQHFAPLDPSVKGIVNTVCIVIIIVAAIYVIVGLLGAGGIDRPRLGR